jgi:hypothetical protein
VAWVRQATEGYVHKLAPFRVAALFVRVMTAIIALHTLEILLWASIVEVLMCGLSVSVLFAIATRLAGRER